MKMNNVRVMTYPVYRPKQKTPVPSQARHWTIHHVSADFTGKSAFKDRRLVYQDVPVIWPYEHFLQCKYTMLWVASPTYYSCWWAALCHCGQPAKYVYICIYSYSVYVVYKVRTYYTFSRPRIKNKKSEMTPANNYAAYWSIQRMEVCLIKIRRSWTVTSLSSSN